MIKSSFVYLAWSIVPGTVGAKTIIIFFTIFVFCLKLSLTMKLNRLWHRNSASLPTMKCGVWGFVVPLDCNHNVNGVFVHWNHDHSLEIAAKWWSWTSSSFHSVHFGMNKSNSISLMLQVLFWLMSNFATILSPTKNNQIKSDIDSMHISAHDFWLGGNADIVWSPDLNSGMRVDPKWILTNR